MKSTNGKKLGAALNFFDDTGAGAAINGTTYLGVTIYFGSIKDNLDTPNTYTGKVVTDNATLLHFRISPKAPAVGGVAPASGPFSGGNSVAVSGTDFTGATAVYFGDDAATSFTVNSDGAITAVRPPTTRTKPWT